MWESDSDGPALGAVKLDKVIARTVALLFVLAFLPIDEKMQIEIRVVLSSQIYQIPPLIYQQKFG